MTEEEEHSFQKSNSCWICKKFINNNEKKSEIIVMYLVNLEALLMKVVT